MKLAFSSAACPEWDLATMVTRAKELGYQGIELRGLQGQMHLPLAPQLAGDPQKVGRLIRDTGVELVCLSTSAAFHMRDPREVAEKAAEVREYIELAGRLGCPFVRIFGSEIPKLKIPFLGYERRETVMARIAQALRPLADYAAQHRVILLLENSGDFTDSASLWYMVDAVDSPALKCLWNPLNALIRRERPTISIPRLGGRIGMIHLCDGKFAGAPAGSNANVGSHPSGGASAMSGSAAKFGFEGYALPGQGSVEIPRLVQLLKGIAFRGYICFDWPRLWNTSLAPAEQALTAFAEYIKPMLDEKPMELTAYKGDKYGPKFSQEIAAK